MEIRVIADRWMMPERQHQDDAGADLKPRKVFRRLADLIDPEGGSDGD
jgi:hypothetical protein